jgi:hypothetical protein
LRLARLYHSVFKQTHGSGSFYFASHDAADNILQNRKTAAVHEGQDFSFYSYFTPNHTKALFVLLAAYAVLAFSLFLSPLGNLIFAFGFFAVPLILAASLPLLFLENSPISKKCIIDHSCGALFFYNVVLFCILYNFKLQQHGFAKISIILMMITVVFCFFILKWI